MRGRHVRNGVVIWKLSVLNPAVMTGFKKDKRERPFTKSPPLPLPAQTFYSLQCSSAAGEAVLYKGKINVWVPGKRGKRTSNYVTR